MQIRSISPINFNGGKLSAAENIFSHKVTKAAIDAPIGEIKQKAKTEAIPEDAKYFPFDSVVGKIKSNKLLEKEALKASDYHADSAIASDFKK